MPDDEMQGGPEPQGKPEWYVVHTYSGYENKVKMDLEKTVANRHLEDKIVEVVVPLQKVTELKNGAKKEGLRKMFPGYVLVRMIKNEDTWYVVRNTRGVTGFVGPGSEPVPLSDAEYASLCQKEDDEEVLVSGIEVGDAVEIIAGIYQGNTGVVKSISKDGRTLTITMGMFSRETPVELSVDDVRAVQ